MPDTTARIRAKGLDTTGVSEAMATEMFAKGAGKYHMAIVEWRTEEPHGPTTEGKKRIDLVLTQVEPARDDRSANALREMARALARQRRAEDGELPLDGTSETEKPLSDATAAVESLIERDETGEPTGVWDGNPDSPLPSADATMGTGTDCPAAWCSLPEGHEGDHDGQPADPATDPESTEE